MIRRNYSSKTIIHSNNFATGTSEIYLYMKRKKLFVLCLLCLVCFFSCGSRLKPETTDSTPSSGETPVSPPPQTPDPTESISMAPIPIDPMAINRLMPFRGVLKNGVTLLYPEQRFAPFWTENWKSRNQSICWKVTTGKEEYMAEMLVSVNQMAKGERTDLLLTNGTDSVTCRITATGWQRCRFPRNLQFNEGTSVLTLKISKPGQQDGFNVNLYSLEIIRPDTYERQQEDARSVRSNTSWMADVPYGFFFHWNSRSMPMSGDPLPYEEAVNAFDVDRFAKTVNECGGKLVFFTTSWAEYYFPAPIQVIDDILPGRTTKRDLVADLSAALGKYGIRLILYYHVGHGDYAWMSKQGFTNDSVGDVFANVEKIVGEISKRYGENLAGLWLDDGRCYYPNGVQFDRIAKAAKSGNKDLVLCFNPWILPKLTDYQDYYAGETGLNLASAGVGNPHLPEGGDGTFQGGPQDGLQATYCGLLEPGEWTHIYQDSVIEDPVLSLDELTQIVEESNKRKNVPMINVRIYQDGTISPKSYALLKELRGRISGKE